tara:strand:- start:663 stop:2585 length:1923 start_codon:yes stop_codon:yes gene_type:complete
MFRKPIPVTGTHKLGGSDVKKLVKDLQKKFVGMSVESAESIVAPLGGKKTVLTLAKCQAPSRMQIYLSGGAPIVIDHSGKGDLELTYFALWRVPGALGKPIVVKHAHVTHYLLKGADLMLPGVGSAEDGPAGDFKKGQVVAISCPGNPLPFAVGEVQMSRTEFLAAQSGIYVKVKTCVRDALWALAASQLGRPELTPNRGFGESEIVAVDGQGNRVENDEDEAFSPGSDGGEEEEGVEDEEEDEETDDEHEERLPSMSDLEIAESPVVTVSMDTQIDTALIRAIKASITDSELPMLSSKFWGQHVVPHRRGDGPALDVKRSVHKKMSKLFCEKIKQGWLFGKEDKHTKEIAVTSVCRSHKDFAGCDLSYETFAELELKEQRINDAATEAVAANYTGAAAAAFASNAGGRKNAPALVFEEKLRPPVSASKVFAELGKVDTLDNEHAPVRFPFDALYTKAEAGEVVKAYCELFQLDKNAPSGAHYLLDPTLCDALFKGVSKKSETFPTFAKKKEVCGDLWLGRFLKVTCIKRGAKRLIKKGGVPPMTIQSERRAGDRKVTRVFGFEQYLIEAEELRETLATKLATHCTVCDVGATKNAKALKEVVASGNAVEKVAGILENVYGVPRMNVATKDLFKGKGKNK